jgi:hypothetical protein
MRRFKEAGLNPNLIYGQTNEAGPVRSSNMDAPNIAPTHVDVGNIGEDVNSIYNVMRAKNENDILKQQKQAMDIKNAKGAIDLIYYARGLKAVTEGKETNTEVKQGTKEADITKGIAQGEEAKAKSDSAFSKSIQDKIMGEGAMFGNLQNAALNLVNANTSNALANANSTNTLLPFKKNDINESAYVKHVTALYIKANTAKNEEEKNKILKEIEVLELRRQLLIKENGYFEFNQLMKGVRTGAGVYKDIKGPKNKPRLNKN